MIEFWIGFSIIVGIVANKYGRSGIGWFFLATLISPVPAILFLLIAGKTPRQRAQEAVLVERLAVDMRTPRPANQGNANRPPDRPTVYGTRHPWKAVLVIAVLIGLFLILREPQHSAPDPARHGTTGYDAAIAPSPEIAKTGAPATSKNDDRKTKSDNLRTGSRKASPTDNVQDALGRLLLEMPGVSRW